MKKKDIVKAHYEDEVMTVVFKDGSTAQYLGDCTSWNLMPFMDTCNTRNEFILYEIWKYIKHYGNDYPTAHDKDNKKKYV